MTTKLEWKKTDPFTPHLRSGPFTLIKRRENGKIFWIARVEVDSTGQDSRNYEVIIWGGTLRRAKELCQEQADATHFNGKKIVREA